MREWLYIAAAPAAMLTSTVAFAQNAPTPTPPSTPRVISIPTVTRIPTRPLQPMTPLNSFAGPSFGQSKYYQQTYELAQNYGRCATNIGPARARAVLNTAPNTRTELTELRQLTGIARPCLPYNYGVPIVFIRGTLAEALYRRQPVAQAIHAGGTTEQQLQAFQAQESRLSWARLPDDRAFATVSNCLVVRAPEQVRTILMSRVGSAKEREGIRTLLAAAPGCSTSKSFSPTSGTTFIRAYLAESALRWAEFSAQ
jgi:hypothetical protein